MSRCVQKTEQRKGIKIHGKIKTKKIKKKQPENLLTYIFGETKAV